MKLLLILSVASVYVGAFVLGRNALAESPAPAAAAQSAVKNVTPGEVEKLLEERKDIVVLDVRTPDEFQEGHIAHAKNVDFMGDDFAKQVAELDKAKTYIVHCASGGRSTRALKPLEEAGLRSIFHMDGGFHAWQQAGKPVAK